MVIQAEGNNVRNAVSAAKKLLIPGHAMDSKVMKGRAAIRPLISSGGEDGLWRITLNTGDIVEVTVMPHALCKAQIQPNS